jgi:hypothetical protein
VETSWRRLPHRARRRSNHPSDFTVGQNIAARNRGNHLPDLVLKRGADCGERQVKSKIGLRKIALDLFCGQFGHAVYWRLFREMRWQINQLPHRTRFSANADRTERCRHDRGKQFVVEGLHMRSIKQKRRILDAP